MNVEYIRHEHHIYGQLCHLEILHGGIEGRLGFKLIQNLLLVPDTPRAAEFAEVFGQEIGDSFAVAPEVCLQETFFQLADFGRTPQYPAAFPK